MGRTDHRGAGLACVPAEGGLAPQNSIWGSCDLLCAKMPELLGSRGCANCGSSSYSVPLGGSFLNADRRQK